MKTRKEVVEYINSGKCMEDADEQYPEKRCWHFGKCDLRFLLDFIYEGKPLGDEKIIQLD